MKIIIGSDIIGIKFQIKNEAYTSKCDGLALESVEKHKKYIGKRKKRGLFQSSVGKLINADVNGALNILRKVVGDCSYVKSIISSGFLFNPVKVSVV
jgi:transposase